MSPKNDSYHLNLLYQKRAHRAEEGKNRTRRRRRVTRIGPDRVGEETAQALVEVSFVGSAKTLERAREMKRNFENEEKEGGSFVIYHLVRIQKPFILWKDQTVPTEHISFGKVVGFDLFRVPNRFGEEMAIAEAIEAILKGFGQTGDASGVPPR